MNAAVRAVIRTALHYGIDVYAIHEGYQGLVNGGDLIRRMESGDADGILHQGGTAIGTARSQQFRTRDGRRAAARHMVERGIDALVVIGGDGSLTGANLFRQEWSGLLAELVTSGEISPAVAADHPFLRLVGLVGSIDNDMAGTDMTIGADTALHRIVDAMDALRSTASSHQRTFVVEVMGRQCGYLALMASLASAANWLIIPKHRLPRTGHPHVQGHRRRPGHRSSAKCGHPTQSSPRALGTAAATRSPPTRSERSWKRNWARTPGSRFWATCNAVGHLAPLTATSPRCSRMPPWNDYSPLSRTRPPN